LTHKFTAQRQLTRLLFRRVDADADVRAARAAAVAAALVPTK